MNELVKKNRPSMARAFLLEIILLVLSSPAAAILAGVVAFQRGTMSRLLLMAAVLAGPLLWVLLGIVRAVIGRAGRRISAMIVWTVLSLALALLTVPTHRKQVIRLPLGGEQGISVDREGSGIPSQLRLKAYSVWETETREGMRIPANHSVVTPADIPRDGRLIFGLLAEEPARLKGTHVFQVMVETETGNITEAARIGFDHKRFGWNDHSIDLSAWAGRRVHLIMQLKEISSGAGEGAAVWINNPRVVPRAEHLPNFVLLVLDTLRADHLSGDAALPGLTPRIAQWAARGVWFRHNYAQSSWTLPSTASLLTSTMPVQTGAIDVEHFQLGEDNLTLAEILKENGYRTMGISANRVISPGNRFDQGFDTFVTVKSGIRYSLDNAARANRACLRLASGAGREPFFLFIQYIDPHWPYLAPWPDILGSARSDAGVLLFVKAVANNFWKSFAPIYRRHPPALAPANHGLYQSEIRYLDRMVGDLLDGLEERGLLSNTVVIITSDHGEEWREHGLTGHGTSLFEEGIRTPLIVIDTGRLRSGVLIVDRVTQNLDIIPTILDRLDIPVPEPVLGKSLLPLMEKAQAPEAGWAFSELPKIIHYDEVVARHRPGMGDTYMRAVVGDRYKLVKYTDLDTGGVSISAYDLEMDPGELKDAAGESPPWLEEYMDKMEDFYGPMPHPEDIPRGEPIDPETTSVLKSLGYLQ